MTKLTYHGLKTQRSTVESTPLMDASKVNLKAKTKYEEWHDGGNTSVEMGVNEMTFSDISSHSRESSWETGF